jgi:hypothetical protein
MRDPHGAALISVREVQPQVVPVRQKLDDIANALAAHDDHHLADIHVPQSLEWVVDHRPVVDRQQMLVGYERKRM